MDNILPISEMFATLRKDRGSSYRQLSKDCGEVFSSNFLCNIELGRWLPSELKIIDFCKSLDIGPEEYIKSLNYSKSLNR